jgi:hypothetical protein
MAQLGDLVRAKALLKSAARAFGPKEAVSRARCVVAEAEIALVSRELGWPTVIARELGITLGKARPDRERVKKLANDGVGPPLYAPCRFAIAIPSSWSSRRTSV